MPKHGTIHNKNFNALRMHHSLFLGYFQVEVYGDQVVVIQFRWSACGVEVEANGTVGHSLLVAKVLRNSSILDSLQRKHSFGDSIFGSMGTRSPYIDVFKVCSFAGWFVRHPENGLFCRLFVTGSEKIREQLLACVVLLCFGQRDMMLRWLAE